MSGTVQTAMRDSRKIGRPMAGGVLLWFCLAAHGVSAQAQSKARAPELPADARRPNLVLILADDLGYGDVGVYGAERIRTPHIDALARDGVRLTQGYVSHPVCSPSRAGLLTGRYQQRHGYEFNTAGIDQRMGLALDQKTMADRLRALGYRTGIIGKWHLGVPDAYHPLRRGFDEYFGIREGGTTYFDSQQPRGVYAALAGEAAPTTRGNDVLRGFEKVEEADYLTDAFTREALAFLERRHKEPFFLYLSHTAPHTPLQATEERAALYADIEDPRARVYAAMVAALDDSVGAVIDKLRELDLLDDTLVVFLSDNGCASYVRGACSNAPLAGFKRYHLEGGVRVPFVLRWPNGGLPKGAVYERPAISIDLLATFLSAAGAPPSIDTGPDSVDLLPFLRGEKEGSPHEYLRWRSGPTLAIRDDRWKLLRLEPSERSLAEIDNAAHTLPLREWDATPSEHPLVVLYDLVADPGENHDVAAEHPEVVARLTATVDGWSQDLAPPLWSARRSTLAEIAGQVVQLFY